jgi:hypothetical protein
MMFSKTNISSLLVLLLAIIATSFLVEADKNETMLDDDTIEEMDKDSPFMEEEPSMGDDLKGLEPSSSSIVAVSASALAVAIISMINLN